MDLLVNNAGYGINRPLAESTSKQVVDQLAVNVQAVVELSHAAAHAMRQRQRGWIVNVSSVAGEVSTPGDPGYGASKSYVTSFSEALASEMRPHGVRVTVVLPGFTRTEFHAVSGSDTKGVPRFAWLSAERVAERCPRGGSAWRGVVHAVMAVSGRDLDVAPHAAGCAAPIVRTAVDAGPHRGTCWSRGSAGWSPSAVVEIADAGQLADLVDGVDETHRARVRAHHE